MPDHKVTPAPDESSQVVRRYLKGEPLADIARELDLSLPEVSRQLALARRRWRDAAEGRGKRAAAIAARLESLEDSFENEWARLAPRLPEKATHSDSTPARGTALDAPASDSAGLFLAVATRLARRVRLTYAKASPMAAPSAQDQVDERTLQEVEDELSRLSYGLELKRKTTSA